mmetsp:Transcript_8293/g.14662  ORF Transcript_8293/g.14662 Transcript_8293/m.14662 type:complete len:229 (-) Transcript_8293:109-795(-)
MNPSRRITSLTSSSGSPGGCGDAGSSLASMEGVPPSTTQRANARRRFACGRAPRPPSPAAALASGARCKGARLSPLPPSPPDEAQSPETYQVLSTPLAGKPSSVWCISSSFHPGITGSRRDHWKLRPCRPAPGSSEQRWKSARPSCRSSGREKSTSRYPSGLSGLQTFRMPSRATSSACTLGGSTSITSPKRHRSATRGKAATATSASAARPRAGNTVSRYWTCSAEK